MYIDTIKKYLEDSGSIDIKTIQGCTLQEIQVIERELGLRLPSAYKEFLLWIGNGAENFLAGTHIFFRDLRSIQEWATELLNENENNHELLPNHAFVFLMHQGYNVMFINTLDGDDPPVYYYNESTVTSSFVKLCDTFSMCLSNLIEGYVQRKQS